jgi:hypothetical protein
MSIYFSGSEAAIERRRKLGYGQGSGANYSSWLRVQDFPSMGLSSKRLGIKAERPIHAHSKLESYAENLFSYDLKVIDIRENYPLPRQETQLIAKEIGVKHPVYPKNRNPLVMSTDFVLTLDDPENQTEAVSIKPSKMVDPENRRANRVLEKLLIEKIYWERRGINWLLYTEKDIATTKAINLDMLRTAMVAKELRWLDERLSDFVTLFKEHWTKYRTLNEILAKVRLTLDLEPAQGFYLFGRSVWLHQLAVDLDSELIGHNFPIKMNTGSKGGKQHD